MAVTSVSDSENVVAVAEAFEHALLERGMAKADTALLAQDAFEAKVEHARYLTAYDLAAMMAAEIAAGAGNITPVP